METTKELIAHVNDLVSAAKPIADQCDWLTFASKRLSELDLEQFAALCEWQNCWPSKGFRSLSATLKIGGVSVYIQTGDVPELKEDKEPNTLDLIKSILADRKAQANAA